ncbi:MAG: hypothetical protein Q9217_002888 [Psora testacea]
MGSSFRDLSNMDEISVKCRAVDKVNSPDTNEPTGPYHAGPGTAHEIGVMIGFIAIFFLITAVYLVLWKIGNKKGEAKERERRQILHEKTTNPRDTSITEVHEMDKGENGGSVAQGY